MKAVTRHGTRDVRVDNVPDPTERRDQDRARDLNRGSSTCVTCGLGGNPGSALSRRV
jgi:hypothetical protein